MVGTDGSVANACVAAADTLCGRLETREIQQGEYVVRNNVHNDKAQTAQCILVTATGFVVTCSEHDLPPGQPASYPSILAGCLGSDCSSTNGLPAQVANVGGLASNWAWNAQVTGTYNVLYTLTFSRGVDGGVPSAPGSQSHLKIWLSSFNSYSGTLQPEGDTPILDSVNLDGHNWSLWCNNDPTSRQEVAYVANVTTADTNHQLLPFIRDAQDRVDQGGRPCLDSDVTLIAVEVGFEIWKGGVGLRTDSFDLTEFGVESCNGRDDDGDGVIDNGFDLQYDPANCGACGHVCPQGQVCSAGQCGVTCVVGTSLCGDNKCHDTTTDNAHCGGCEKPCPAGQACSGGRCAPTCAAGTILCGDNKCHDLATDSSNCGGCEKACSFDHAIGVCSNGQCVLGACAAGRVDLDRKPDNGCECEMTVDPNEVCDGKDNNCDGLIDIVPDSSGAPTSICKCNSAVSTLAIVGEDLDTEHPTCTTNACASDGAESMDFCCDVDGSWSQCLFGYANLEGFDADHGNNGMLEVAFQLKERVVGLGLSLWYGDYPRRKRLDLITAAEKSAGIGPGNVLRYFLPGDASCPAYTSADKAKIAAFADFPDACLVDKTDAGSSWMCKDGKWGTLSAECAKFPYNNVLVYLTAEFCGSRVASSVSVLSIRYVEPVEQCRCRDDSGCASGQLCRFEAQLPAPWCGSTLCAGICSNAAACPGYGLPCLVAVGGNSCESRIVCSGRDELCAVPTSCQ